MSNLQRERQPQGGKGKIYFPNLNGLRFIAAFLVIIHHIEQFKAVYNLESYWNRAPFIDVVGKLGVVLFFVLSGFLITYLLLSEESSFGKVSIPKFYIRRMLRIWPLYFLIITLAFAVLPYFEFLTLPGYGPDVVYSNLFLKLLLFGIFFPNLALSIFGVTPYASHTWSIGTEEQYYLIWPVILKGIRKHRVMLMLFIIMFYMGVLAFLTSKYSYILPYRDILKSFWSTFNIDCMAIGGIFGIWLFDRNKILGVLRNNLVFYPALLIVILLIAFGVRFPYFHYEIYAVVFGIIILNFASNDAIKNTLEFRWLNYLGNVSYGLYMYHPLAIVLALSISIKFGVVSNWIIYPLSVTFTIIFAGLSYRYFETFFLKYKDRFSLILSGNRKSA